MASLFYLLSNTSKINSKIANAMTIHIGESTHHQDHEITLHSLKVIKTMVRSPQNPIPPDLLFCDIFTKT